MNPTTVRRTVLAVAVLALAAGPAGAQQRVTDSGTVTYVPEVLETTQLANGNILEESIQRGMVVSDSGAGSHHLASQDCAMTTLIPATGAEPVTHGLCHTVDRDGDLWWLTVHSGATDGNWEFVGGTGKYEGIAGGGTSKVLAVARDGRYTVRWQGEWTQQ